MFHRDEDEHAHEEIETGNEEAEKQENKNRLSTTHSNEEQTKYQSNKNSKPVISVTTMPATGKTVQQRLDALNRMGSSKNSENQRYSVDAKVTAPNNNTTNKIKPSTNGLDQKRHSYVPDLNQLEQERKDRIVREKALRRKNLDDKMQDLSIEEEVTKKKDSNASAGKDKADSENRHVLKDDILDEKEETTLSPTVPDHEYEQEHEQQKQQITVTTAQQKQQFKVEEKKKKIRKITNLKKMPIVLRRYHRWKRKKKRKKLLIVSMERNLCFLIITNLSKNLVKVHMLS